MKSIFLAFTICLLSQTLDASVKIYVSPRGDDGNTGSLHHLWPLLKAPGIKSGSYVLISRLRIRFLWKYNPELTIFLTHGCLPEKIPEHRRHR